MMGVDLHLNWNACEKESLQQQKKSSLKDGEEICMYIWTIYAKMLTQYIYDNKKLCLEKRWAKAT